jgi:CMP/dCMP kinase
VIIAIDGPSGAGKGTVARYLADQFNLKSLDTGLLYRVVAKYSLQQGLTPDQPTEILKIAQTISVDDVNQEGLRGEEVAARASQIAVIPDVRAVLNQIQRDFAHADLDHYAGVILDGRDIGTAICPDADCKLYLTADPETRALRRLQQEGQTCPATVQKMMADRDQRDTMRPAAPLAMAKDAYLLDTTYLTIDEACQKASYYIQNSCLQGTRSA